MTAWNALGSMLVQGRSLSGRERNCCFLNTGERKFADISAVSGFDFPDDTRGLAVTDWDHDGDLDIWMTNRTAPRIRFLRNDFATGQHTVMFKLQGTASNRDAVGSRVGIDLGSAGRFVRALRAGDGYLGQSSKWLHFGLGEASQIHRVIVRWPNGKREAFRGVAPNGRYLLIEGSGKAVLQSRRMTQPSLLATSEISLPEATGEMARIVLPARLPLPDLTYLNLDGTDVPLIPSRDRPSQPLLINLWATWCQPCLKEIGDWSKQQKKFEKAGVKVVLLCVDAATEGKRADAATIRQLLDRMRIPFAAGLATPDLLDTLEITQQVLTKRIRPMPVPTSFLIDGLGRLSVVYKGQAGVDQVLVDIGNLSVPQQRHRDLAVEFPGRWYTNPFPPDSLAIPTKYQELGQPEQALRYLQRHATAPVNNPTSASFYEIVSAERLARVYVELAKMLQVQNKPAAVIESLRAAAALQPNDGRPRLALAMIFQQSGRPADAVLAYREMLKIAPSDPVASNNLAWLLATSADAKLRAPDEAIRLAENVCQRSRRKLPSALDTLAAAYAAAGRFDDAVSTINEAISLQRSAGQKETLRFMQARLHLYSQKQAFIESGR